MYNLDNNDLASFMEAMGYHWEEDFDDYPAFVEGCKETAEFMFNQLKQ